MKIVFVSRSNSGKPHAFVEEQANALASIYGFSIDQLVIPVGGIKGYWLGIKLLYKKLRSEHVAIVHVHYGLWAPVALAARLLARKHVSVVVTYHGSDVFKKRERPVSIMSSRFASWNILVSKKMIPWFAHRYSVIPCGVDTDIFYSSGDVRSMFGLDKNDFVVLFSSSFNRDVKDPLFAFSVIEQLTLQSKRPVRFIEMTGFNREQLTRLMQCADCLLMCSKSEGSPQVIKEAILNSLPVVSNDVGEVAAICEGIDHTYIVPKNVESYVSVLLQLSASKERITDRSLMLQQYDNKIIAAKVFEVYNHVLGYPLQFARHSTVSLSL